MAKKMNVFLGIVIVAIIIILAVIIFTPKETGAIQIGSVAPLSGDGAVYGLPIQKITNLAIEEVNNAGGINGRELQIVWEDGKCNPKDGLTATQNLVNVRGLKVILGGMCSGELLGATDFAEKNKVILFSLAATSPDVTDAGDYIFRSAPSDSAPAMILAKYLSDNGYQNVAILSEMTDYAQGLRKVFKENLIGVEVLADETFTSDQRDVRTQLTKIKNSGAEALLLLPQTIPTGGILAKQANELSITSDLFGNEIFALDESIKDSSQYFQGLITAKILFDESIPRAKEFADAYRQKYGENCPIGPYCGYAYDGTYLLVEAIKTCDGVKDTDCIRDSLYNIKDFDGTSGKISIDENGDVVKEFFIQKLEGEEFVTI